MRTIGLYLLANLIHFTGILHNRSIHRTVPFGRRLVNVREYRTKASIALESLQWNWLEITIAGEDEAEYRLLLLRRMQLHRDDEQARTWLRRRYCCAAGRCDNLVNNSLLCPLPPVPHPLPLSPPICGHVVVVCIWPKEWRTSSVFFYIGLQQVSYIIPLLCECSLADCDVSNDLGTCFRLPFVLTNYLISFSLLAHPVHVWMFVILQPSWLPNPINVSLYYYYTLWTIKRW